VASEGEKSGSLQVKARPDNDIGGEGTDTRSEEKRSEGKMRGTPELIKEKTSSPSPDRKEKNKRGSSQFSTARKLGKEVIEEGRR